MLCAVERRCARSQRSRLRRRLVLAPATPCAVDPHARHVEESSEQRAGIVDPEERMHDVPVRSYDGHRVAIAGATKLPEQVTGVRVLPPIANSAAGRHGGLLDAA